MYVRACADDECASVGIEIHSFLVARVITQLAIVLPTNNFMYCSACLCSFPYRFDYSPVGFNLCWYVH